MLSFVENMLEFYNSSSIKLEQHGFDGNKWPFKEIGLFIISLVVTIYYYASITFMSSIFISWILFMLDLYLHEM